MPMSDTRERLDRAIDGAVRQMMAADPPADLRRRVTDRLAEPARRAWLVPAMAAAAVAVVVIATVLLLAADAPAGARTVDRAIAGATRRASSGAGACRAGAATGPRVAPEPSRVRCSPAARSASAARRQTPATPDIFGPRTDRVSRRERTAG